MKYEPAYELYRDRIVDLISQVNRVEDSHNSIAQDERIAVSDVEKRFLQVIGELEEAEKAVREQYHSVCDSCAKEGLKKPLEQRPTPTELCWQEAVKKQEYAASRIRDWFTQKAQAAIVEKQKRLQEEAARKAAIGAAQEEAARKQKEEEAQAEKRRASALIDALKQKHKKRN